MNNTNIFHLKQDTTGGSLSKRLFLGVLILILGYDPVWAGPNEDLIQAIQNGDSGGVIGAIKAGADINKPDSDLQQSPPIVKAARYGYSNIIFILLENGANPNAREYFGAVALDYAADQGNIKAVKILVDHGADVNAKDKFGTPLISAMNSNHLRVLRFLLKHGADINAKNIDGLTAEEIARQQNHPNIAALIKSYSNHNGKVDKKKLNASLFDAVRQDNRKAAKTALVAGADVNAMNNLGFTPLQYAELTNDLKMGKILIAHGADPNKGRDSLTGINALSAAAMNGRTDFALLLLNHGANVNARDRMGGTALGQAIDGRYIQTSLILIQHGADINAKDHFGETVLMEATKLNHAHTVLFLLKQGADANAADLDGTTALMIAAEKGYNRIVKILLDHGADVKIRNTDEDTAADIARTQNHLKTVNIILKSLQWATKRSS